MCGICGVFGQGDQEVVRAMLGSLVHRGPDDEHVAGGPDFALGARRLSIVDLAGGRQPLSNESGTVWAAQNGELYNFPTLRQELAAAGHRFSTRCDTEVLPHLYEEHGTRLVERIDGMFAVAVWDDTRKLGLLARDRMGKKPLFYVRRGDALYFASEIKSLLRVPGVERRLNLEALHYYLSYKHVPHPLSIFAGIQALPPAHALVFRPGRDLETFRYWDLDFSAHGADAALPEEELVERLLDLLRRGVERRLMSDVPIGFFLSGGIDSSLSTALAAELSPGRIKTFTLTYAHDSTTAGKEEDRRWADWTARRYGTEHYEERIEVGNFPEHLRRIIACFDEPFAGVVSTYFLSRLISQHVKVALAGDGADELFGSYLSHRLAVPLANHGAYLDSGNADLIRPFQDQPGFLAGLAAPEDWVWRYKLLVWSDEDKCSLYAPEVAAALDRCSTREHLRQAFAGLTGRDPLNRMLEFEFRTFFPDQVLTFVDRLSMAHSLEVRSAFLDTDLVTFVAGLPGSWKIRGGETKYLLKKAALQYFPREMVFRPKEGFIMPITQWLLHNLQDYAHATLSPERLSSHGLFRPERVQELLGDLYKGGGGSAEVNRVFSLLVFQEWYDLYMARGLVSL